MIYLIGRIIKRKTIVVGLILFSTMSYSQIVNIYIENFDKNTACTNGNCYADGYNGWKVTSNSTGANPNKWFVSCAETGTKQNFCGTRNCSATNGTLHIGSTATAA